MTTKHTVEDESGWAPSESPLQGFIQTCLVGQIQALEFRGRSMLSGIVKMPVSGPVMASESGLSGDQQADLTVHGGRDKAIYAYPLEHYSWWRNELPGVDLEVGVFGENLSISELLETEVRLGDVFRAGTATLQVTLPRWPCHKLVARFALDDISFRFQASGRSGFYLAVLEPGVLGAGDRISRIATDETRPTISEDFRTRWKSAR